MKKLTLVFIISLLSFTFTINAQKPVFESTKEKTEKVIEKENPKNEIEEQEQEQEQEKSIGAIIYGILLILPALYFFASK